VSNEQWPEELRLLAGEGDDIVEILNTMAARHDDFRSQSMVAAAAVREGLGISVTLANPVIGWLKGQVSDEKLRRVVPRGAFDVG
jgi:hypothetical protein